LVTDLEKEAPNVVTEPRFKELLARGYQAEVLCQREAHYKSAVWYGEWTVRIVNRERTFEKPLVNIPRRVIGEPAVSLKVFKTINGLTTFMARSGFTHVHIPLLEGGRSSHALPSELLETDNDG
jgi:hypothetical protein